jgi:two-component system cell cycle sensor histidine kinase/response regulator CckA
VSLAVHHLVARDVLVPDLLRVTVDERAGAATPSVFAVYEDHQADAPLRGLVTREQIGRFSQRIFADLLPKAQGEPVPADASLETVAKHMEDAPTSALAVLDSSGRLLGAVTREALWTAMLDQQRRLFAELAAREGLQRAMLGAIPDQLLCVDADGRLSPIYRGGHGRPDVSPPTVDSGGVPVSLDSEDSIGKRIAEVFPADVAKTLIEGVSQTVSSGKPGHAAFSVSNGEATSQYEARFVSWGTGNVLIICRDVTEVIALRAKLVMSDRMVSIGTLAAGVAHEINNPLTYVSASLEGLRELLLPEIARRSALSEATTFLDDMRDGLDRVGRTVRDLKLFSRSEEPSRAVVDLKEVLARVLRIANNEIRHRATLVLDLGDVPLVDANDGQLGQVFLNLLVNAAQAIPEGDAERNEIRVVTRTDSKGRAVVEVHDTGSGISDDIKTRIFAPFFTTKDPGVGTGLGLSICHGIIMAHGGDLEVESTVGKGSIFRVVLVPSAAVVAPSLTAPPAAPQSGRKVQPPAGRFLVVDDEVAILKMYPRYLGRSQCVACASGRDALELFRRGERFDVILCDLMMPQTSGMDVYDELVRTVPEQAARMIFVTGGAFTDRARHFLKGLSNPTLDKPFDSAHLFESVTRVLAKTAPETAPETAP